MTITFDDAFGLRMPATMSADEVLIRAREATIEFYDAIINTEDMRAARHDDSSPIQAILIYERDRAKPLAEVAPHTAEDPDERAAYEVSITQGLYHLGDHPSFAAWRKTVIGRALIAMFHTGKAAR